MGFQITDKIRSASVPHIKFDSPETPFPHFSFHTRVLQFGWRHSGKFALLFSFLIIFSILVPFTLAVLNGNSKPLLPLISQESENESQNGFFSITLYTTALVGSIMASVRYVHVSSQNEAKNWRLNVLNKLGLTSGFACFVGLVVVASFRVSLPKKDEENLDSSVLVPHILGGFFAFFFGALYLLFQTCISLFFYEGNARIVVMRFTLFLLCSICFAAWLEIANFLTLQAILSTLSREKVLQSSDIYLQIESKHNALINPPAIRNISEWLMVIFFASYFLTFVKESHKISVVITFRHFMTGRRISLASLANISKI